MYGKKFYILREKRYGRGINRDITDDTRTRSTWKAGTHLDEEGSHEPVHEFCAIAVSIETLDPLASRVSNSATAIPRMLQTGSYFKYRYREIISCCVRD